MEIYWQGKDITGLVQVRKCISRDACGERCDSLEMEFDNAAGWMRWGPEEDDQIVVIEGQYSTGVQYLNTILPEDGNYRVMATSLPCAARKKEYRSYTDKTLNEIMQTCGVTTGMGYAAYGLDEGQVIPYIQQECESAAAFLARLLKWESASLKVINGKYAAISLYYAQARTPCQAIRITANQRGAEYTRDGAKWRSVTVKTPFTEARAEDRDAPQNHPQMILGLPAKSPAQAGRWARGVLLHHNRQDETLTLSTDFNPGFSALARINITGGTDADGAWLVEDAEHDLKNKASRARLLRCITTIE